MVPNWKERLHSPKSYKKGGPTDFGHTIPHFLALSNKNMSQNDPKTTSLMTSVTKTPHSPTKKFFFECNLLDWPIRLSSWTAL